MIRYVIRCRVHKCIAVHRMAYLWVSSDRAPDPILHNTTFMRKVHTTKRVPILPYLKSKYEKTQKGTIQPIFMYRKPVCGSGSGYGSGSSISSESGSGYGSDSGPGYGSRVLMTKNWKKYSWNFFLFFFWSKIAIYLSLGLQKWHPNYRRSLQPSKDNIQHFKKWNLLTVFYFSGPFLPSRIRIRIRVAYPDTDHRDPTESGYGSTTLWKNNVLSR